MVVITTCERCGGRLNEGDVVCSYCSHINGYAGAQVWDQQDSPHKCPKCDSDNISMFLPDFDEVDSRWSHLDLPLELRMWASFVYDHILCSGCGGIFSYGSRWYFDEASGHYTRREPNVPREYWTPEMEAAFERQQRKAQIEAGQLLLPGVE